MTWTDGHYWEAEIPMSKLQSSLGPDHRFEFKFMVKFNNTQTGTYNIIRWEGGMQNHVYHGEHIYNMIEDQQTKQLINAFVNDPYNSHKNVIKIGSFQGTGQLHLNGSMEEQRIPDSVEKCQISYD